MKWGWGLAVGLSSAAFGTALLVPRADWWQMGGAVAVLAGLAWAWSRWGSGQTKYLLLAAAAVRIAALVAWETPTLSEDWVRYAWDGWVLAHGEWPTEVVPERARGEHPDLAWDAQTDWMLGQMNSPQYPGVYPPLAQAVFALPWLLGTPTPMAWWRVYQLAYAVMDLLVVAGLVGLLRRHGRPARWAAAYAFHPLVLFEGVGNGHLEGWVIAAGVAAAWAWPHRPKATLTWALAAISLKWLPVLALPAWAWQRRARWRSEWGVWLLTGLLAVGFAALAWTSMRLFLDKFEFNAGPYYAARNLIMAWTVHNPIRWLGPGMTVLGFIGVLWSATRSKWSLAERWTAGWGIWLACATTVHPWYALYLIPLGAFTRWKWPLAVSAFPLLSYGLYDTSLQKFPWIALQWALILTTFIWEWAKSAPAALNGSR